MNNALLITLGKTISKISRSLNRGNGSTWPGHIALRANKNFVRDIFSHSKTKVIIIAGTNGKTTTSGLIKIGLQKNGKSVLHNESGANLLNGVASTILLNTNARGKLSQDYAIFEVDENTLPLVLEQVTPDFLVLLNLFRDQLDRYGEINTIVKKWQEAILSLPSETKLILNADDPQIAYMGMLLKHTNIYFGVDDKKYSQVKSAADSISCPHCGKKLIFESIIFSHLGKWKCSSCSLHHPQQAITNFAYYPLYGTYNKYNTNAAVLVLKDIGLSDQEIVAAFKDFTPAFGRQEIIKYNNKKIQLFLSKNPTSFNQSFNAINDLTASTLLIVLNDRIPDGRDISWIWDTDLSGIERYTSIILSGDRVYDMALRLKYALGANYKKVQTYENLKEAITISLKNLSANKTLYILPNYSAMLEVRKILTGKKIL